MRNAKFDFDLFVIGGGSGGVRAARLAAQSGARVGLAEASRLGGTCVNAGCVPKKLYSYAGHYADAFRESRGFGWTLDGEPRFDWSTLKANRAREIARLNEVYGGLLDGSGVTMLHGRATLRDPNTVEVAGKICTAQHILIATGGSPFVPGIPGAEYGVTSDDVFDLPEFPNRLLVIGGGYIGCEFASIFTALGASVTQVQIHDRLIPSFDEDVSDFLAEEMRKSGVDVRLGRRVSRIERTAHGLRAQFDDGEIIESDVVLFATGRVPLTHRLGLENAGVALAANGAIEVDAQYRSSVPTIFAVGDVSTGSPLTPVALAEATVVVDALFHDRHRALSYEHVPTAVFTHPNVGTVGLTEAQARERYRHVDIYRSSFRPLKHTLSGAQARTLMKLVVDRDSDKVLGVHMVGDDAGEIVQGFAVALRAGATKQIFDTTIGIHPTSAEEFVTMRQPIVAA
ncbi:glutathione-disulfide reductase [Burkholderia sp. 3C]